MKPYLPDTLPLKELNYKRLFSLVGEANAELALYNGLLQGMVNAEIMLSPLTNEEAVLSSKIEGTQATVYEVLEQEAGIVKEGEKLKDIQEIINYRRALQVGHAYLSNRKITLSFLREIHTILMNSVRGKNMSPGEFRRDQNWIGAPGCTMEQAVFVPPHPLQLQDHLENWQKYVEHNDIDMLLQTAIVHAQFELIHPFKDGNGRIGRILIPLFLYKKHKLSQPMFYLSAYLEAQREEYYARLQNISRNNDWNSWIEFFLRAIREQAQTNNAKVQNIMRLYESMKNTIHEITHSQYAIRILDAIFTKPIFETTYIIRKTQIPKSTATGLLNTLKTHNIIRELISGNGSRPAILYFPELISITEGMPIS